MLHQIFSATINLIVRDSEALWLALFLSTTEVGYYKVALAIINLVLMPITPFISTTYPEMSRSVSEGNWQQLKNLLRRVTKISGFWTGGCVRCPIPVWTFINFALRD